MIKMIKAFVVAISALVLIVTVSALRTRADTVAQSGPSPSPGIGLQATNAASTVTLSGHPTTVYVMNCGTSCAAQDTTGAVLYVRAFSCGAALVAVTVATGTPIPPGPGSSFKFSSDIYERPSSRSPDGYCKLSVITASSTTRFSVTQQVQGTAE